MALYKLEVLVPDYREVFFGGKDIKGIEVYINQTSEKMGSVDTLLLDETKSIRYIVVDIGFWFLGKKILLPAANCRVNAEKRCIDALGLTNKEQAELIPAYDGSATIDSHYENKVIAAYQELLSDPALTAKSSERLSAEHSSQSEIGSAPSTFSVGPSAVNQDTVSEQTPPEDHHSLKLYAEKLVGRKRRQKTGEITVRKQIITDTDDVSVPTVQEKIVIEITSLSNALTHLVVSEQSLQAGEVARLDIYQEIAETDRQMTVQQEVKIRKEVEHHTAHLEDTVRKEELDIQSQANASS